jgi:hypothetical protein
VYYHLFVCLLVLSLFTQSFTSHRISYLSVFRAPHCIYWKVFILFSENKGNTHTHTHINHSSTLVSGEKVSKRKEKGIQKKQGKKREGGLPPLMCYERNVLRFVDDSFFIFFYCSVFRVFLFVRTVGLGTWLVGIETEGEKLIEGRICLLGTWKPGEYAKGFGVSPFVRLFCCFWGFVLCILGALCLCSYCFHHWRGWLAGGRWMYWYLGHRIGLVGMVGWVVSIGLGWYDTCIQTELVKHPVDG